MFELFERNRGLIPEEVQKRIQDVSLLIVGCGLGSIIAELAVRTGFYRIELWDGDRVEIHNLNRQLFNVNDVGRNKAKVVAKRLIKINPEVHVKAFPKFLETHRDIQRAVVRNAVIVNTADPDRGMWVISEMARKYKAIELFPINAFWQAYCLVLTPETPSLEEILGEKITEPQRFYPKLILATTKELRIPPKVEVEEILRTGVAPQLGTTSFKTAAIVVEAIVKLLMQEPVPLAPTPIIL